MKALLTLFRSVLLIFATATALAQSDSTPPVVESLTFTPGAGDITNGPATITVTARITDALSGVSYLNGSFHSPSAVYNRISGTALDGIYRGENGVRKTGSVWNGTKIRA